MSPSEVVSGWDDDSLAETARQFRGDGADEGLPPDVRFQSNVAKLIRRRMAHVKEKGAPSVFLLLPEGPSTTPAQLDSVPMLNNGVTAVEGYLWFVGPVAARGSGMRIEHWDDQSVFDLVGRLAADHVPAILYETRKSPAEARYFAGGLGDPDRYEVLRLDSSGVTLGDILDVVNRLHEDCLKTPNAQGREGRLWEVAKSFHPYKEAERRIAHTLRAGLVAAFLTCTVRDEQSQPSGRLDLEIEEAVPGEPSIVIRHAILELKVLRSFRSSGAAVPPAENERAVNDGVRQAASYRKERGSSASALCCFDMRREYSGDQCLAPVRALAQRHSVVLRIWHIFPSAQAWREHLVR